MVPMDLLDPHLPSSRALQTQKRDAVRHKIKIALGIVGGVLGGGLLGAGVMWVLPLLQAKHQTVTEISVSFVVGSEPRGAAILVDGKSTGQVTPSRLAEWDFSLPHRLSVELEGFYPERQEVAAGLHPPDLSLTLARLSHLTVRSQPSGASVFLGQEDLGVTPNTFDMPADRDLELTVRLAGYVPKTEHLRLNAADNAQRDVLLHAMSRLSVNSEPLGARVSLDGQRSVVAPVELEVESTVPHHLEVSVPGLPAQSKTVTLKDNQHSELTFRFEDPRDRPARAEQARIKLRLAVAQKRLDAIHGKQGSSEFFSTVNRLHNEDQLSDEIDRLEARDQEISDELANHQLELEDRIKVTNIGAKHE
jgi:hypothetical protein